jgi:uncharacterized SAM-binding protein YcdF (DUF218 family)
MAATQRVAIGSGQIKVQRQRRQHTGRRFTRLILLLMLLVIVVYAAMIVQVYRVGAEDNARPADTIIVLGAAQWSGKPSPVLQARLDHALELYQQGLAQHIITTGGTGPGDQYSEADVAADYLQRQGVPLAAIEREDEGRDTWESMQDVSTIMRQQGWHSAILVSDPFHMWRAGKMASDLGIVPYTSPTRTSPISADKGWELQYVLREPVSFVAYLLGLKD